MPVTLPLRSVVFTLMTPLPPRLGQAIFVGGCALAVAVLGYGEDQRALLGDQVGNFIARRCSFRGCLGLSGSVGLRRARPVSA